MTDRIGAFIRRHQPPSPCLIVDLEVVRANYAAFRQSLPYSDIYYAVKANPDIQVLSLLETLGSRFDCASVAEISMVLRTGADASRISFGNTIKKERDIARAFDLGVRLFAVDSHEEVEKVARAAPGSDVFCRILTEGAGAEWPLSRKFGCDPAMAARVLLSARDRGLTSRGVSFHVGSQMTDARGWDTAIASASGVFSDLSVHGVKLDLLNLGGGFPTRYTKDVPATADIGAGIMESIRRHFGAETPRTIIEPGRGMVGNAGVIRAEVVLASRKSDNDRHRWVFLDIGKFGGLAETMDEAIRYDIRTSRDGGDTGDCVVAGPTCDSADVLYEKNMYPLPLALREGDEVLINGAGAYTATYSSVAFNGFEPLRTYII